MNVSRLWLRLVNRHRIKKGVVMKKLLYVLMVASLTNLLDLSPATASDEVDQPKREVSVSTDRPEPINCPRPRSGKTYVCKSSVSGFGQHRTVTVEVTGQPPTTYRCATSTDELVWSDFKPDVPSHAPPGSRVDNYVGFVICNAPEQNTR